MFTPQVENKHMTQPNFAKLALKKMTLQPLLLPSLL